MGNSRQQKARDINAKCRLLSLTLVLVVTFSLSRPVGCQVTSTSTVSAAAASNTTQDTGVNNTQQEKNATTPWPPDDSSASSNTITSAKTASTPPTTISKTTTETSPTSTEAATEVARHDDVDVTTATPSSYPFADLDDDDDDFLAGRSTLPPDFDVMKNKTFQVVLGVCMSLCILLILLMVLMMFYTKYRGWKDRMNIAPTVRTGGQVGSDRQELMQT